MLKVKDHVGLYRDPTSKAIISDNVPEYHKYLERKRVAEEKAAIALQKNLEIEELKTRLDELTQLVHDLLGKSK